MNSNSFHENPISSESNQEHLKPFLRWAGGKQQIVRTIATFLPNCPFNNYFEPFLGAGSLFLYNNFKTSILSDINPHLINSYKAIKEFPEELYELLVFHKKNLSSDYYYQIRQKFNLNNNSLVEQASYFIFLIHTSFNGIYRVNKKNEYNVPYGKPRPALPSLDHLKKIQSKLVNSKLLITSYESIIKMVRKDDFIYFDPPYPPLTNTSFFQHYTTEKFPEENQLELASYCNELNKKEALIMISNADTPLIKRLFKNWNVRSIDTIRYINCKSERKHINELIITNY